MQKHEPQKSVWYGEKTNQKCPETHLSNTSLRVVSQTACGAQNYCYTNLGKHTNYGIEPNHT